ncbi:hypothetical protein IWX84_001483 [Flavobacterium sp. CG_9.10]|nr:hypothetical protein [Flavobacterium sp. CG_9.10]
MYCQPFFSKKRLEDKDNVENFREIRKEFLSYYLRTKKREFTKTNELCFEKLLFILDDLDKQYSSMKLKLI